MNASIIIYVTNNAFDAQKKTLDGLLARPRGD